MFLEIKKLIFVVRSAKRREKRLGRAIAIGGVTFAIGAALAFGLSPMLRERAKSHFRPRARPEPRVAEWPPGTSRSEGSPPSAWEPEQDGDG
jgi:hypothetical protein